MEGSRPLYGDWKFLPVQHSTSLLFAFAAAAVARLVLGILTHDESLLAFFLLLLLLFGGGGSGRIVNFVVVMTGCQCLLRG